MGFFIRSKYSCKDCGAVLRLERRPIPGRSAWLIVPAVLTVICLAGTLYLDIRYKRPSGTGSHLLMLGGIGSMALGVYLLGYSYEYVLAEDAGNGK